jgi:hypothetical protein
MSREEIGERFEFAAQKFYSENPDASPFALDNLNKEINKASKFEELDSEAKEFIEKAEYEAFKEGQTPPWFVEEEELDEDAPLTETEKQMMKDWE